MHRHPTVLWLWRPKGSLAAQKLARMPKPIAEPASTPIPRIADQPDHQGMRDRAFIE